MCWCWGVGAGVTYKLPSKSSMRLEVSPSAKNSSSVTGMPWPMMADVMDPVSHIGPGSGWSEIEAGDPDELHHRLFDVALRRQHVAVQQPALRLRHQVTGDSRLGVRVHLQRPVHRR